MVHVRIEIAKPIGSRIGDDDCKTSSYSYSYTLQKLKYDIHIKLPLESYQT